MTQKFINLFKSCISFPGGKRIFFKVKFIFIYPVFGCAKDISLAHSWVCSFYFKKAKKKTLKEYGYILIYTHVYPLGLLIIQNHTQFYTE